MKPEYIVIHHSLTEDGKTVNWQAIREYHINTQKWLDVGYHYGIELVNERYEILKGRMDNIAGAHCLGFNDCSIGICCIGNFDETEPSPEMMGLLVKLVKSLMAIYNIPVDKVIGHWQSYELRGRKIEKTCPGNKLSIWSLRKALNEYNESNGRLL